MLTWSGSTHLPPPLATNALAAFHLLLRHPSSKYPLSPDLDCLLYLCLLFCTLVKFNFVGLVALFSPFIPIHTSYFISFFTFSLLTLVSFSLPANPVPFKYSPRYPSVSPLPLTFMISSTFSLGFGSILYMEALCFSLYYSRYVFAMKVMPNFCAHFRLLTCPDDKYG
ncbi:hypothetical protein P691DRAFT_348827 [Macrolepiota fuliginosa MF-IS2]|uniref:Uncharacterized protein n=1 Tax=Macrolepiota fuliginosa MF-IS2 TaxID=1400762 RepID=A0A9P5X4M4_9AGAR|nr:hypothetical protein P691DRAFT_348827 [Macrolepiota fuliginosa MF-IS2]